MVKAVAKIHRHGGRKFRKRFYVKFLIACLACLFNDQLENFAPETATAKFRRQIKFDKFGITVRQSLRGIESASANYLIVRINDPILSVDILERIVNVPRPLVVIYCIFERRTVFFKHGTYQHSKFLLIILIDRADDC